MPTTIEEIESFEKYARRTAAGRSMSFADAEKRLRNEVESPADVT